MVQARNNSLRQGKTKSVRVDLQGPNASGTPLVSPLLPLCRLPQVEVSPKLFNESPSSQRGLSIEDHTEFTYVDLALDR